MKNASLFFILTSLAISIAISDEATHTDASHTRAILLKSSMKASGFYSRNVTVRHPTYGC